MFWNLFIRIAIEMFYPVMLVALLGLSGTKESDNKWLDILKVLGLSGFMVFTFVFMRKHKDDVEKKEWRAKYGSFLANI